MVSRAVRPTTSTAAWMGDAHAGRRGRFRSRRQAEVCLRLPLRRRRRKARWRRRWCRRRGPCIGQRLWAGARPDAAATRLSPPRVRRRRGSVKRASSSSCWRCSPLRSSLPGSTGRQGDHRLPARQPPRPRRPTHRSLRVAVAAIAAPAWRSATPPPGRSPPTAPPAAGSSSPADARGGAASLTASTIARLRRRLAARHTPDTNAATRHARAERWPLSQAAPVSRLTRDKMKREEQS